MLQNWNSVPVEWLSFSVPVPCPQPLLFTFYFWLCVWLLRMPHIRRIMQYLSFCVCGGLSSLRNISSSQGSSFLQPMIRFPFFLKAEEYSRACRDHVLLIHLSVSGHCASFFGELWLMLQWVWVCGWPLEACFPCFLFISRGRITESYDNSTFRFSSFTGLYLTYTMV